MIRVEAGRALVFDRGNHAVADGGPEIVELRALDLARCGQAEHPVAGEPVGEVEAGQDVPEIITQRNVDALAVRKCDADDFWLVAIAWTPKLPVRTPVPISLSRSTCR